MAEEQTIMNNQKDKIAELVEHLQVLGPESPFTATLSTPEVKPSNHLCRRLNNVERNVHSVKEEINSLTPGPGLDRCLLQQLEEQVGSIMIDLSDVHVHVTQDILSSEKGEENLLDWKDRLHKVLFNLTLQIKHLLHNHCQKLKVE